MKTCLVSLTSACAVLASPSLAVAHYGHLGELAGHSHWIGLGAVVIAGLLGAAIGLPERGRQDDAEDPAQEHEPDGAEEEAKA